MENSNILLSLENVTANYAGQVLFSNLYFIIKKGEQWAITGDDEILKNNFLKVIQGDCNMIKGHAAHNYFEKYKQKYNPQDPFFNYHNLIAQVSPKHRFKNLSNTSDFYYQQRYNSFDSEDALLARDYLLAINSKNPLPSIWTLDHTIKKLKLANLIDKQLIKLSNGETKRLTIAAALLKKPVILLLDNPFTGLDINTRRELDSIFTEIAASGITLIMSVAVTEIPDAITHVAVIKDETNVAIMPKELFNTNATGDPAGHQFDAHEITSLLSANRLQKFKQIVKMENVSIRYGQNQVLDGISWEINQGERWALLGPNGAGKSTLLSLITADNPQSYANRIVLFDRKRGSNESIWDIKRNIGFVSPELHQYFYTRCTCLQVAESGFFDTIGLFKRCTAEQASIALRWMRLLGIEQVKDNLFDQQAASNQRLCLLARSLVKNPALLIFDEPCHGLNRHQQENFKNIIDTICANSNTTLIYVTHYQEEIPDCVTKILRLDEGKFAGIENISR